MNVRNLFVGDEVSVKQNPPLPPTEGIVIHMDNEKITIHWYVPTEKEPFTYELGMIQHALDTGWIIVLDCL